MKPTSLSRLIAAAVLGAAILPVSAQTLAVVNGKTIPASRAQAMKAQFEERTGREIPPEMQDQIREEIITREILAQEATRLGLDKTPAFREQLELARQTVLIRELFLNHAKKNKATHEEIKAEYDKFVAANQGKEYRVSHILVESEERAKAIIADVNARRADFAAIAQKESKDPGSGHRGGDLGWAQPERYVPEFAAAMLKLQKEEMSSEPVKSDFGWHILRMDDVRDARLPALEEIRDQIAQELEQRKVVQYQEALRSKARVQ